jgi:uncharacterized membrane protein
MAAQDRTTETIGFTKGRVEALTDGIYGFAMTLLVIGVGLPTGTPAIAEDARVYEIIVSLVPDFIHYVIAFLILARFWVGHHIQYNDIHSIDRRLLWINTLSLLFVALVPFSTTLAGDYPDSPPAALVLEINMLIIGLIYFWQWRYATRDYRYVDPDLDPEKIRIGLQKTLVIPAISVVAVILSLSGIPWSILIYMAIPVVMATIHPKRQETGENRR